MELTHRQRLELLAHHYALKIDQHANGDALMIMDKQDIANYIDACRSMVEHETMLTMQRIESRIANMD